MTSGNMFSETMFHTQEKRGSKLSSPIKCTRLDSWFGCAYYFWKNELDADKWGQNSKTRTGFYDVYSAEIESDNILDTVFDEKQYTFFEHSIEKALRDFENKTHRKPDKKFLCNYIMKVAHWDEQVDGILFADSPKTVIQVNYCKRIQLALYKIECMLSFKHKKTCKC